MKPIEVPRGLSAIYTYDHERGWTCCTLVDKDFNPVCASGFSRYNPKDFADPKHPFDPLLGCHIALGRAVKNYYKANLPRSIFDKANRGKLVWHQHANDYPPSPFVA